MSLKYCQKDCHQDQPVAFYIKQNNNWNLCCAMCQYESDLPKQQFTAIKDLEKINKETLAKLDQSNIINNLQNTLNNVKLWQSQFESLLQEVKSQIQQKIAHFSSFIQTLNQNVEYFIINNDKLEEVLNFKEQFKVNLDKCADDIINLNSNLADALQVLQLASPFQQQEVIIQEITNVSAQTQGKPNSIINEQKSNINTSQQIQQNIGVQNAPNQNTTSAIKNQEIKQQGKIEINQNEYYEGEIYKGMMHGKGKIFKTTPLYELIIEGDFVENKKHGKFVETHIEIEPVDINQSFFKSLTLLKPGNQKKILLKGEYKNDKKTEIFTKITYLNDVKESEKYQFYEDNEMIEEFE